MNPLDFLNNAIYGTPFGPVYDVIDKTVFGGALPGGFEEPVFGTPVVMPGGDIKYTTPGYGPQSGESFRKVTGQYPKGFEPAPKEDKKPASTGGQGYGYDPNSYTPPAAPTLPGKPADDTITQQPLTEFQQLRDELKKILDPDTVEALSDIRNKAYLERSVITSALAREQSKELTARRIEEANIQAWKDARVAQINANATQAAALASAIWASSQMNPSVVQNSFQAALRPITLTGKA